MAYRRLALDKLGNVPTVPDPLAIPGDPTELDPPHAALRSLDTVVGSGRRVLWALDLQGALAWLIPDGTDTDSAPDRVYPDKDTPRVVGRVKADLSPGSLVMLQCLAAPSGPTQVWQTTPTTEFVDDHGGGKVRAVITYTAPDGVTTSEVSSTIVIPQSEEEFAAEPPSVLGAEFYQSFSLPGGLDPDPAEWIQWLGLGVTIEARIEHIGSPRVIEVALVERPTETLAELGQPWPSTMYVDAGGAPLPEAPSLYPIIQASDTDEGFGTNSIGAAIAAHGDALGPVLFWWSSADEDIATLEDWISYDFTGGSPSSGLGDDEAPPFTVTGTTPTRVPLTQAAGWTTGAHGPTLEQSGEDMLRLRAGVLPVWIHAYWRCPTATKEAILDVYTSDWDKVRIQTAEDDYAWTTVPAWIEVGTNPEDALQVLADLSTNDAAADADLRHLAVSLRRR